MFPREPLAQIGETRGYPIIKDVWGGQVIAAPHSTEDLAGPIPDITKAAEYRFPDVSDFSFDNLERWCRESDLFTVCQLDTGFFQVYFLVGFTTYMLSIESDSAEISLIMERLADLQIRIAQKRSAGEPIASGLQRFRVQPGPFINPKILWDLDFQYEKRIVDAVHKLGVPCVLHACGCQTETLDMIVETGIDALHAMQPSAHNDIRQIERYENGFPLSATWTSAALPFGSPWDVDQDVKSLIRDIGSDGGYVLTTCNGIMEDVPVENAITMHMACEKYGHYPIDCQRRTGHGKITVRVPYRDLLDRKERWDRAVRFERPDRVPAPHYFGSRDSLPLIGYADRIDEYTGDARTMLRCQLLGQKWILENVK